ncbi:MAG: helix-turn-helix transcriptional regulator [Sphingobacterium sp.]
MTTEIKKRFDRIVEILIQLQSRRLVKAKDLADHFQVSLRTIYRDIRSLEQAGVPLIGEAGLGYSLVDGYRLPPVSFTKEEALSFASTEKLVHQFLDKKTASVYDSALSKIRAVLKRREVELMDVLEGQIVVNKQGPALFPDKVPHVLSSTVEAIASKRQLEVAYQGVRDEQSRIRQIEPIGILHEMGFWFIIAYCLERKDFRQFRSDRIQQIELLNTFCSASHTTMDEFIATRRSYRELPKTEVRLLVDKSFAHYMQGQRNQYGFLSERPVDDQVEMIFASGDIEQALPRWLLMFGDKVEIVEPQALRDNFRKLVEKIASRLQ